MTEMTAGVTTSVIGHAAILLVALAGLSAAKPLQPEVVDSIAVDLVPLADVTNVRQGTIDSKVVKTDTPAVAESSKPAQLAQKTGNTDQDQVKPEETSKASPAPVENTAPKPVPTPTPTPVVQPPKPADPVPPPPVVAPDPAPAPVLAQPQKEVVADTGSTPAVNVAPVPASKPAVLQKAPVKAPADAVTDVPPPPRKVPVKTPQPDTTKTDPNPQARTADKISDLLNAMDSRGATTGAGGSPTLGKATGGAATLSQTMLDMLSAAMRKCFHVQQAAIDEGATAVVQVHLTPDGRVDGDPTVVSTTGATTADMTGVAAVRAVILCGQNGYTMLPANLYAGDNGWNTVQVTFNASDAAATG